MSFGENMTMTMPMTPAGYGSGGGFGLGNGGDWMGILFLVGLLGGWGNNGGGLFGGGNSSGAEVQRGFDHSATITKLDGITTGIADATYALNNTVTNGFANAELGAANRQAAMMQQLFAMQAASQQCCCETQRQIERGFCETQNAMNGNTQAILNKLSQIEYNGLQDKYQAALSENQALRFQASQTAQNGFIDAVGNSIVAQLRQPVPIPAYQVPNPYVGYGYGCGAPCGC